MSEKTQAVDGGIGFSGALTILFIGLKLGNVINWSWWWVLCPLWAGLAIGLTIFLVILMIYGGNEVFKELKNFWTKN